jgi:hypothetical protein
MRAYLTMGFAHDQRSRVDWDWQTAVTNFSLLKWLIDDWSLINRCTITCSMLRSGQEELRQVRRQGPSLVATKHSPWILGHSNSRINHSASTKSPDWSLLISSLVRDDAKSAAGLLLLLLSCSVPAVGIVVFWILSRFQSLPSCTRARLYVRACC